MKKYLYNKWYLPFLLLATSTGLSSCINENHDDCPPEILAVEVYYSYREPTRTVDPTDIESVSLFVFDNEGVLAQIAEDASPVFGREYYHSLILPEGNYQFVSWLNFVDCCYSLISKELVIGETKLSDMILAVKTENQNMVTSAPHNLYYGYLSQAEVKSNRTNRFTVPVIRDTYVINVRTQGLPVNDEAYELMITDRNGRLRFDNSITAEEVVSYITECQRDVKGQLYGSLTVLRLFSDYREAVIRFRNTDTDRVLLDSNLIDLIMTLKEKGLNVDFSNTFEYEIVLRFDADLNVTVTINGWTVIDDGGQVGI